MMKISHMHGSSNSCTLKNFKECVWRKAPEKCFKKYAIFLERENSNRIFRQIWSIFSGITFCWAQTLKLWKVQGGHWQKREWRSSSHHHHHSASINIGKTNYSYTTRARKWVTWLSYFKMRVKWGNRNYKKQVEQNFSSIFC